MAIDPHDLEAMYPGEPSPGERAALVDRYTDGECLTFAFAVHWMTGWPVEGLSERDGDTRNHLHFAAVGPDGLAWDAAGPRNKAEVVLHFADNPVWEVVDAQRLVATQPGIDEDAITQACIDAFRLLGRDLARHVTRLPTMPSAAPSPR